MVSKTKKRFSSTYCNCSRGYLLELFEQIFEKPVKVDLVESVIQGAKSCKFIIHIYNGIDAVNKKNKREAKQRVP
jgi:predicted hydrocarbon binding protein